MDPVKHEFRLSDGQVGFLGGMAHAIGFALSVVPFGLLADRTQRSKLLATLVAAWSGLTMLAAFAVGPISLAFLQMEVGAAEGGRIIQLHGADHIAIPAAALGTKCVNQPFVSTRC